MKNIHQCIKLLNAPVMSIYLNPSISACVHKLFTVAVSVLQTTNITSCTNFQNTMKDSTCMCVCACVCVCVCVRACMWVCCLLKGELSPRWNHYIFASTYRGNTLSKLHRNAATITGFMQGKWTAYIWHVNHLCHYAIKLKLESHLHHPPQILGTSHLFILH